MPGLLLKSCVAGTLLLAASAHLIGAAQLNEADVARSARLFRIQTYQNFRHDRQEYDRRIRLAGQMVDQWYVRGAVPWEARRLIDWFQRATAVGGRAGLPSWPFMSEETQDLPAGVILEAMPDIPSRPTQPPISGESLRDAPQTSTRVEAERLPRWHTSKPLLPSAPLSAQTQRSRPNDDPNPGDSFQPTVPPLHRRPVIEELLAVRPVPALPMDEVHLANDLGEDRENDTIHPPLDANRYEEYPRTVAATARSLTSSRQKARDRRADVGTGQIADPKPAGTDPDTTIKIDVLVARIAGFNLALVSVQDKLADNSQLNYTQLEAILNELERLRAHRDLSRLYVRLLAASRRQGIVPLQPIKPVLELLELRVSKALSQVRHGDLGESQDERSQAIETLTYVLNEVKKWTVED